MSTAAESPHFLTIPQPQSTLETDLEVPPIFVDRFKAVTELAYDGASTPLPHHIAAVVIDDESLSVHEENGLLNNVLADRAHSLASADRYIREHPGTPFVNANRAKLTAGVVDRNNGLTVINWDTTISYDTGLIIPACASVGVYFSGDEIIGVQSKFPTDEQLKFMTPKATATSENVSEVDLVESLKQGGVLAVGKKAVEAFFAAVSKKRSRSENAHIVEALQIALPILELVKD